MRPVFIELPTKRIKAKAFCCAEWRGGAGRTASASGASAHAARPFCSAQIQCVPTQFPTVTTTPTTGRLKRPVEVEAKRCSVVTPDGQRATHTRGKYFSRAVAPASCPVAPSSLDSITGNDCTRRLGSTDPPLLAIAQAKPPFKIDTPKLIGPQQPLPMPLGRMRMTPPPRVKPCRRSTLLTVLSAGQSAKAIRISLL